MAKAKSGSFYIRREVDCSATTADVVNIDTSAYVDPADRQGIMVEAVDFIFYDSATNTPFTLASTDRALGVQLLTGAYTTLQPFDEEDLVASGGYVIDGGGGVFNAADLYPDVLGTQDGRIVVDDNMSLLGAANAAISGGNARCAVIIKAKVVTLTNKDYMALALQTVAN